MNFQRLGVKLFVQEPSSLKIHDFVPVFHTWIQEQSVEDHLLIDVHDYSHVHRGPGILLVAHEGNFSMDLGEDRLGLFYYRKQPLDGSPGRRFQTILKTTLQACRLLEDNRELAGIRFKSDELLIIGNDRLLAPNTGETFEQFKPVLSEVLTGLIDSNDLTLTHQQDPQERFAVVVKANQSPGIGKLLERLSS